MPKPRFVRAVALPAFCVASTPRPPFARPRSPDTEFALARFT